VPFGTVIDRPDEDSTNGACAPTPCHVYRSTLGVCVPGSLLNTLVHSPHFPVVDTCTITFEYVRPSPQYRHSWIELIFETATGPNSIVKYVDPFPS
jgi:hypothetical protein